MLEDRYRLPLTTTSQVARDAYIAGVGSVISGVAGYRDDLARAIEADRSLALAHAALARGLFMDGEVGPARASVKQVSQSESIYKGFPRYMQAMPSPTVPLFHLSLCGSRSPGLRGHPLVCA
jgi:hypothetical protein